MKKIICSVLIVLVSMIQFLPVFADTQNVTSLEFNDIESIVTNYNQDIRANNSSNIDTSSISSSIINLTNAKTAIDKSITDMQAKVGSGSAIEDDIYSRLIALYNIYSGQIQGQIGSLEGQLKSSLSGFLRSTQGNYAIISGTQQLFLLYSALSIQREELNIKAEQINAQLNITRLQKDMGMISESAFEDLSLQAQETEEAIKTVDENMDGVKSQINLMLGQSFNCTISLGELPLIDNSLLAAMNYNTDLETGRINNFDIRQFSSSDTYIMDNQTRKYKFTFDKKYKDVINSKKSLDNEFVKLGREEKMLTAAKLKYDAGIISKVDMQKQNYAFKIQLLNVKTVQKDLLQAYTAYQWLLRGYETSLK